MGKMAFNEYDNLNSQFKELLCSEQDFAPLKKDAEDFIKYIENKTIIKKYAAILEQLEIFCLNVDVLGKDSYKKTRTQIERLDEFEGSFDLMNKYISLRLDLKSVIGTSSELNEAIKLRDFCLKEMTLDRVPDTQLSIKKMILKLRDEIIESVYNLPIYRHDAFFIKTLLTKNRQELKEWLTQNRELIKCGHIWSIERVITYDEYIFRHSFIKDELELFIKNVEDYINLLQRKYRCFRKGGKHYSEFTKIVNEKGPDTIEKLNNFTPKEHDYTVLTWCIEIIICILVGIVSIKLKISYGDKGIFFILFMIGFFGVFIGVYMLIDYIRDWNEFKKWRKRMDELEERNNLYDEHK